MTRDRFEGLVRHILGAAGAYVAARGLMDQGAWEQVAGAVTTLAMAAWSWRAKRG